MRLPEAIQRAQQMIEDIGPYRLSILDRQAVEALILAGRREEAGITKEECMPLKWEDVS